MVKRMLNCTNHLPNSECVYCVQAFVVQENGQMKILVGQHHVHIHTVNTYVTSYPLVVVSCTPVNSMHMYTLSTLMSALTLWFSCALDNTMYICTWSTLMSALTLYWW